MAADGRRRSSPPDGRPRLATSSRDGKHAPGEARPTLSEWTAPGGQDARSAARCGPSIRVRFTNVVRGGTEPRKPTCWVVTSSMERFDRQARNEAVLRAVNEEIAGLGERAGGWADPEQTFSFECECGKVDGCECAAVWRSRSARTLSASVAIEQVPRRLGGTLLALASGARSCPTSSVERDRRNACHPADRSTFRLASPARPNPVRYPSGLGPRARPSRAWT
jgi:hypothetical protein